MLSAISQDPGEITVHTQRQMFTVKFFSPGPTSSPPQPLCVTLQPHPRWALENPYRGVRLQQPLQSFHTAGSSRLPRAVPRHCKTPPGTPKPLQHSRALQITAQPRTYLFCHVPVTRPTALSKARCLTGAFHRQEGTSPGAEPQRQISPPLPKAVCTYL